MNADHPDSIFQFFFIPPDAGRFYSELDTTIGAAVGPLLAHAQAFRRSLESVFSVAGMPYRLVWSWVRDRELTMLMSAEAIHLLGRKDLSDDDLRKLVVERAQSRLEAEEGVPERRQELIVSLLTTLMETRKDAILTSAVSELLRQATVLAWSSLEVLAQDLFVSAVNATPDLVLELTGDEQARRLFSLRDVPLDLLAQYGFDVSQRMGEVLAQRRSIDSVQVMKVVYRVIAPSDQELMKALGNRELWILNQRRNLIVHRRAIVDEQYLANTGESLQAGQEIVITPQDLDRYLSVTRDAGIELIRAATGRMRQL